MKKTFSAIFPADAAVTLEFFRKGEQGPCASQPMLPDKRLGLRRTAQVRVPDGADAWRFCADGVPYPDPAACTWSEAEQRHPLDSGAASLTGPLDPAEDGLFFYKAHVRGLTMKKPGIAHKGTFAGMAEMIPPLPELGVTALLLIPSAVRRGGSGENEHYWG